MSAQFDVKGQNVAVTGAAGFIGRAIIAELARAGARPISIVRPGSGTIAAHVRVAADLLTADLEPLLEGCTAVVNCAARVHITSREKPVAAEQAFQEMNAEFPLRLAQVAQGAGVSRFIQISSVAAIRSITSPGQLASDAACEQPHGPYGRAKLAADRALAELASPSMTVASLRPPAVYGPGVGAFFELLMRAARAGLPLPLGRFQNRRSFIFVENVADAVVAALGSQVQGSYIVTDSAPLSTADLYRRLLSLYGHGDRVVAVPPSIILPLLRAALRERTQSLIGDAAYDGSRFAHDFRWSPRWTIDQGLARTVAGT